MSDSAANIVRKVLYLARIGRLDLLWTVNVLARAVTKWTQACDKRLERLIGYLYRTRAHRQFCHVGNSPDECSLGLFQDASFAGDLQDSKSTSGGLLCVFGSRTFVPITWMCKKQTAVSHSSAEAEVISLDAGLRMEGLPSLMLWDQIIETMCGKPSQSCSGKLEGVASNPITKFVAQIDYTPPSLPITYGQGKLFIFEDNEAVIKMVIKGRSPNLRHVPRTH